MPKTITTEKRQSLLQEQMIDVAVVEKERAQGKFSEKRMGRIIKRAKLLGIHFDTDIRQLYDYYCFAEG